MPFQGFIYLRNHNSSTFKSIRTQCWVIPTVFCGHRFILYKRNPTDTINIVGYVIHVNYYVVFSCAITMFVVSFWIKKVSTGLAVMAKKIEEGDYEYFNDKM